MRGEINIFLMGYRNESITVDQCGYCVQFGNAQDTIKSIIYQIITPAPGMKQVLDKPGSCGQYENYQRPESFQVGKQSKAK